MGADGTAITVAIISVLTIDRSSVADPAVLLAVIAHELAFDFTRTGPPLARIGGWRANRLGYLTEQMFGYGLACYARLRAEPDPGWARYLDTNPRVYMKHGLAYLGHAAPGGGLPAEAQPG